MVSQNFSDVDAAGSFDEGPRARLLHDVDHFLLESHFVTTKRHPDRHWRVKRGSVMGMQNSGELSDTAFAKLVGTWSLLPEVMSAFSINLADSRTTSSSSPGQKNLTKKITHRARSGEANTTFRSHREVPGATSLERFQICHSS